MKELRRKRPFGMQGKTVESLTEWTGREERKTSEACLGGLHYSSVATRYRRPVGNSISPFFPEQGTAFTSPKLAL